MHSIREVFSFRSPTQKNRILILDFIRGILILLVLYHHSSAPLSEYVLQFHMPALFILSGYTEFLLDKKQSFSKYIKSRFFRLIVPYFAFEIATLLLYILIRLASGSLNLSLFEAFKYIFVCVNGAYSGLYGRLWFLPAMFVSSVFAYVIKTVISKGKPHIIALSIAIMMACSYISASVIPFRLPFTIDIAFLGTAFFLLGHLFGKIINLYLNNKKLLYDVLVLMSSAMLFTVSNICADPYCYMYINQYQSFPFMILAAISGTAFVFVISKLILPFLEKVRFFKDSIIWYSVNSLVTFPVHLTVKVLSIPVLSYIGLNYWPILLAAMFILNVPITNIITRYFPIMLGNFKPIRKGR